MIKSCVKYNLLMLKNPLILIEFLFLFLLIMLLPTYTQDSFSALTAMFAFSFYYIPMFLLNQINLSVNATSAVFVTKIPLINYIKFSIGNSFFSALIYATFLNAVICLRCGAIAGFQGVFHLWILSVLCFFNTSLLFHSIQFLTGNRGVGFLIILFVVFAEQLYFAFTATFSRVPLLVTPIFSATSFWRSIVQILPLCIAYISFRVFSLLFRKEDI